VHDPDSEMWMGGINTKYVIAHTFSQHSWPTHLISVSVTVFKSS
jgi:hypothetical protein